MKYTEWIKEAQEAVGYEDKPKKDVEYTTDNGVDYYPKDTAGRGILDGIKDSVGEFLEDLDPTTKDALIGSLIGAGLGGLTGSVVGGTYSEDGSRLQGALNTGGLGALTGGLAGGLGGLSLGLIGNGRQFDDEVAYQQPWQDDVIDSLGDKVVDYPFAAGGAVLGGGAALNALANQGSDGNQTWRHLFGNLSHRDVTMQTATNLRTRAPIMTTVPDVPFTIPQRLRNAFFDANSNIGRRGLGLLALPALAGVGYMADKYIDGGE